MNEGLYRRAAVEGASSVALVVMLYDRLVADVQRAIAAMQRNDIETRCAQLKHALLVLQQLEGSLDHEHGGKAARNLAAFYAYCRCQIMDAQLKRKPELLEKMITHILEVRSAWQKVEGRSLRDDAALPTIPSANGSLSCTV